MKHFRSIFYHNFQKQSPEVFYIKKVFLEILQNSQENTCVRDSFLIELQTSQQHFKKETLAQAVSCEYCEISKNTFFAEHLWATASGLQKFAVGKKKTAANKVKKPADVP